MSGDENLKFDIIHPLYKGGKQKMRSIRSDITFESLVKVANETSHWEGNRKDISIHYLHHNGKVFSLVGIEDDNEIKCMLTLSRVETNEIYLDINRTPVRSGLGIGEQQRPNGLKMHHLRDEICASTDGIHDAKIKAPYVRDTRCPTISLSEDDNMHFSSKPNIASDELAQESDTVLRKYLDGVESDDEVEAINIEIDHPGNSAYGSACLIATVNAKSNVKVPSTHKCEVIFEDNIVPVEVYHLGSSTHGSACLRATVNAKSNVGEPSTHRREVIFEDNMVPEEFPTDLYHNTSRDMWLGREFPDHENFRRTIAKFAMYNNFKLLHLKTSQFKVTARCKDRDCPLSIHASIIESGHRFKVRTYNPVHKCSKPKMGTTHRQASSELIAEYILDKVCLNNNMRPKEIMNDYHMEFGVIISFRKAHIARKMALL